MSRENYIDTDKLIETIGQGEVKFFLESQSVELELKVAIRKGEAHDSTVYVLGSFEGAGLDGLHTLKVKIDDGSTIPPELDDPGGQADGEGGQPGGSGKPKPPPPGDSGGQPGGSGKLPKERSDADSGGQSGG